MSDEQPQVPAAEEAGEQPEAPPTDSTKTASDESTLAPTEAEPAAESGGEGDTAPAAEAAADSPAE